MQWALEKGGWTHRRWIAVDAKDPQQHFWSIMRPWHRGSALPGLQRINEVESERITTRAELACLSSWQTLIENLSSQSSPSGWFLLMEDDVGSSLACPDAWPINFAQLIKATGPSSLIIQLAPISSRARYKLYNQWHISKGKSIVISKKNIRSHGNGAVLLNQKALPFLRRKVGRWLETHLPNHHFLTHPYSIRPVADKWLYGSLPAESSWVCTYPLFCLDANDSNLHHQHVKDFHIPSRDLTLKLWKDEKANRLLEAFKIWNNYSKDN
ncbi:hypothetical protein [Synechococcus sp. GEYO]|uniref:hypothetical protein n=1 Tax=Synechococcus sp. GEYO TaxID=2575511 RepID=UPI0010BD3434|nr:hypothetical protein [Synechococcus sp. GEYO]